MNQAEAEPIRERCRRVLREDETNINAWEWLGRTEYELHHLEQARAAFERAVQLDHTRLHSWDGLGHAEHDLQHDARDTMRAYRAGVWKR